MFIVLGAGSAMGQRVYATASSIGGNGTKTNVSNAHGASSSLPPSGSSPASISVTGTSGGLLSPGNTISGYIELIFSSSSPSNSVAFIKISNITLTNGSTITYELYSGTTLITSTSSTVKDIDGTTYAVVRGSTSFNKVRIIATGAGGSIAFGAGGTASADIYFSFYNSTNSLDCGQGLATSWSGTLGGTVTNQNNAIDGDINTKSTLTPGLLASNAEQTFYFSGASTTSDVLKLSLSAPASALSATLLNNITVTFYNGNTSVYSNGLGSLLSVNLLNSLGNGEVITTSITPNVLFDRVSINFTALLSVLSDLYVHEVERVPAAPTFSSPSAQNVTICSGSAASLVASTPPTNYELRWYSSEVGGSVLSNTNPFTPSPTVTTTYYVSVGKVGCLAESERIPATVTVNPTPPVPTASAAPICTGSNGIFNVNNPDVGYTYKWYTVATGGSSLFTGTTYTTPSTLISNTTLYVEAINGTCPSATRGAVTITVNPKPLSPHVNISSN